MARSRRFAWAVALAVAAAVALAAWVYVGMPAARSYATVPLTRGTVARAVTATGTVNPVVTVQVGSYVSGVITSVQCDYNTHVAKGQLCAKIDPRPYQTVVDQDQANLAAARAQMQKDETALQYAQLAYTRNQSLSSRGLIPQDTLDQSKSAADQARAQMQLDATDVQQRQAALAAAQVNLGYTDITSPVDGTVVSRNITPGQTVAASFQTPTLFLIATDLTKMQVDTNVSESDIGGITPGREASFTVEAYPARTFSGAVAQVRQAPQTVQNVVTYDVVVSAVNADLVLKPGMTATVRVITAKRDNVLRVPDQALRYAPGGVAGTAGRDTPKPAGDGGGGQSAAVWVLRQGKPVRVLVTVGLDDDTNAEIVSGALQPGDRVIVSEESGARSGTRQQNPSTTPRFRF